MSSSSSRKMCFNSKCKEASEMWRRGWRRRNGEYAHLCDRCASAYEDGKFCETFHLNSSGWRCCESCGKQIHCGCIVSFHMFVLLDAGGIECLTCAKNSYILTPNPAWPPPLHFLPSQPERMKDLSVKSWNPIVGSGPVPWRQAPSLFNGSDVSGGIDRHGVCERLSTTPREMKQECLYERLVNGNMRQGPFDKPQNVNTGFIVKEKPYPFMNDIKPVFPKNESSANLNLARISSSETDNAQMCGLLPQSPAISIPVAQQVCSRNGMDSSGGTHIRNGKARVDGRCRDQLLPRYRPQITGEELQQISSDSKTVITPLFEKMLSASDAGRVGRLVVPKKCAEAYFPSITQPEGLPLEVQDVKGTDWIFQFRFWPNNNSRMYVLEGITPCIQSMQLQAGDVVTFSRLEPEGKLVMGGRKTLSIPTSDQDHQGDEITILGSNTLTPGDGSGRNKSMGVISVNGHNKVSGKILEDIPTIHSKRKNSNFSAKSKRLRIHNDDMIELKITWKEAQGLIRPPAKIVPSFVVVEGCEFEEFEEAEPVIGRPTIPGVDRFGEKIQWVQCEDCFKWRKVPADALLPSRWICSENSWDLDRSLCSSPEELTKEQLEQLLPTMNKDSSKNEITEREEDLLDGLDALANLAIQGEEASLENRTKHPRHKPGCTCIVCLQPPSGKGSKHKQPCECVVCLSLRRRCKTLMESRDKKKNLERIMLESSYLNLTAQQLREKVQGYDQHPGNSGLNQEEVSKVDHLNESNGRKCETTPLKGQIDLNIQPEREEDSSPASDSGPPMKCPFFPVSGDGILKQQQKSLGSNVIGNLVGKQMQKDGVGDVSFVSCVALDAAHHKTG